MRFGVGSWLVLAAGIVLPAAMACAQPTPDAVDPGLLTGERQKLREGQPDRERRATPSVEVEAAPAAANLNGTALFVGAITITGLERLGPADFADIVSSHIGRTLAPKDLSALANAVARRMRERGYVFATAAIDHQTVQAGVLRVTADEGRIDEIRFDGPSVASVAVDLAPLVGHGPVTLQEVERRLLIAGDNAGVRVQSSRFVRDRSKGVLLVTVRRDPASIRLSVANQGTRTIGPVQARIDADLNGLIDAADRVSVSYSTTPLQPSELQFGRIRYARDLGSEGTEIALAATASAVRPGSYLAPFAFRSRSWAVSASLTQPLLRRRAASFWLEGELAVRSFRQWRADAAIRRDRLTTARLTVYGNARVAGGRWRMSASLARGLDLFDATRPGDPLASRADADGTYTTLSLWSDWTAELGHGFSMRLGAQGQLSSEPLPLMEEMTLGGTAFLRGYDWGERGGDRGAAGLAELRYMMDRPLGLVPRAQLYAFADGGLVSNLQGGAGGGSLASAGGGMRVDLSSTMGATVEVAVPLSGPRYDTGTRSSKINLGLVRSF